MRKLILILTLLLLFSGCVTKEPIEIIDDNNEVVDKTDEVVEDAEDEETFIERALNSQYTKWEADALAGVMFIGYGDYDEFDNYLETKDFQVILNLYPNFDAIDIAQTNYGEVMLFMLSRYPDTQIVIVDDEDDVLLAEDDFDALMLRVNQSELRPDVKIILEHNNQKVEYEPMISMMDGRLEKAEGIMDLSLYLDYNLLYGTWEHKDFELAINYDSFIFEDYKNNLHYTGDLLYDSPIDFIEDFDGSEYLIYFYLTGEAERYQIFGKYVYSLIDDDTLLLKHISYDPLFKDQNYQTYTLKRK